MPHGERWKRFIPRLSSGKLSHPILKSVIFIFMSTAADFILWNSITAITRIPGIPKCRNRLMSSFRMACSGLKKEWDKNSIMKRGIGPLSVQLPDAFEFIMPAC